MHFRNVTLAALAFATVAFAQQDTGFQERYAANLNIGESYINVTNTGANGAPLLGPGLFGSNTATGNICVNVYAIDPNEELISCCSCLVTPDQTVNLGVNLDLTSQTLTGVATIPTSVTVALVATLAGTGGSGSSCQFSAGIGGTVVNGMAAWGTSLHGSGAYPGGAPYSTTETSFTPVSGSAGGAGSNLASLVGRCASIIGNGSNHGICISCAPGALGGAPLL
jgi:hypothetical protein